METLWIIRELVGLTISKARACGSALVCTVELVVAETGNRRYLNTPPDSKFSRFTFLLIHNFQVDSLSRLVVCDGLFSRCDGLFSR